MARPKRPRDLNLLARELVGELTHDPDEGKDPKAVRAGRLGGKEGGKARAEKLNAAERKAIARKAASARWQGKRKSDR